MTEKNGQIYQFKITLNNSKPPIWRRILVPSDYSFWDLHVAIQNSMGWLDCHLHAFEFKDPLTKSIIEIGMPDEEDEFFDRVVLPEHIEKISKYFGKNYQNARYEYDFGDSWVHRIKFEKILPITVGEKYPQCIAGKLACPPEDCGGIGGYYNLLTILSNPKNDEYKEMIEWLGREFNPNSFDPDSVFFDDPRERWKLNYTD